VVDGRAVDILRTSYQAINCIGTDCKADNNQKYTKNTKDKQKLTQTQKMARAKKK